MRQDTADVVDQARNMDIPEETRSVQNSMIASSSPASITDSYLMSLKDTSFPRCHFMAQPGSQAETFNASLSMLGNGSPLWDPIGQSPGGHKNPGISIGDVGFLSDGGDFEPFFNIFLPPEHPGQHYCPPDLVPLSAPLDSEIARNPMQFPPGTALVSNGIDVSNLSSSPLDIKFKVNGREGGIFVLPDGASREDLVSTTRILDYVQKHAMEWYLFAKKFMNSIVVHPNGTLYVVTGTDKAATWASCVTFTRQTELHRLWKPSEITYRGARNDLPHRWESNGKTDSELAHQRSRPFEDVDQYALFIRGMRIALNVRDWTEHLLRYEPPDVIHFTVIRTVPSHGLRAKIQTLKECRVGYKEQCPVEEGIGFRIVFHPLDVILRLLLEESPSCTIAYIEDHIWCSVVDRVSIRDASLAEIVRRLVKILETHETLEEDGRVTLVPRKIDLQEQARPTSQNPLSKISTYIKQEYHTWSRTRKDSSRLAKVFPGPNVPPELFPDDM